MAQDYESVVRDNYRRMSTEELIERKERGGLTAEAASILDSELAGRGVAGEEYSSILESVKAEEKAIFDLPDGVEGRDLASPGIRLVAHFIDHFVALGLLLSLASMSDDLLLLGLLAYVAYYIFSDALPGGKSLGKRVVGIKVIGLKGLKPCTPVQALQRNILMMVPLVGFLDMLSIFGRRYQRWGDRWAETIVVKYR